MKVILRCALCALFVMATVGIGLAQVTTGVPPFSSFSGGEFDSVNLANLDVHFSIPIVNKAGRGLPFVYALSYDSLVWQPVGSSGSQVWSPVSNTWGWQGQGAAALGSVTNTETTVYCYTYDHGIKLQTGIQDTYKNWAYIDHIGTRHAFSGEIIQSSGTCTGNQPSFTSTATDGSALTLHAVNYFTAYITRPDGLLINPPVPGTSGGTMTDRNGNQISLNSTGGTFTDTLNTTALTFSGTAPNPVTMSYTAPSNQAANFVMYYTTYTVATNFGASGISEYGRTSISLVDHITLPDSTEYVFSYEQTPSTPSAGACTPLSGTYQSYCVTGRIAKVSLPTGGSITYAYSGGSNGINPDGTTATLNRTLSDGNTSSQWTYAHSSTTTVTDPDGNDTYIYFSGLYELQRTVSQLVNGLQVGVSTITTCYNQTGSFAWNSCNPSIAAPFTRRTLFTLFPDQTGKVSEVDEHYDGLENLTERDTYDYGTTGSGSPGAVLRKDLFSYSTLSNTISGVTQSFEVPSTATVTDAGGTQYAKTSYGYDASIVSTSGIPQHVSVTGSHGLVTSVAQYVTASSTLSMSFSYYDTGVIKTATDVNSAQTMYNYGSSYGGSGSCNGAFPTSVALPLSLTWSYQWSCEGAVMTASTDPNSQTTYTNYTQDNYYWRPESVQDPQQNITSFSYSATQKESVLNFNSSRSTVDILSTLDGLGRQLYSQQRQGYGSSTFDSMEYIYDPSGRLSETTMPYAAGAAQSPSNPIGSTTSYDVLNRPTQILNSDGGNINFTYSQNDIYQEIKPNPSGENTKRKQLEYDGLGRLTSVCEITSGTTNWPAGNCAQSNSQTGYWTKYQYNPLGQITAVTQNAQSGTTQSRGYAYDELGRMTLETNGESGTTDYLYDGNTNCGSTAYDGDLVRKVDAVGNVSCYTYDQLHRALTVTYTAGTNNTPNKTFVYDNATVNNVAMPFAKGHLAEAYTGLSSSKITDIGFGYSQRGEPSDIYEWTQNSGGYYHINGTYWPHGVLNALSGIPGVPTFYYGSAQTDGTGLDGEGRVTKVTVNAGQNPVTAIQYTTSGTTEPISSLTQVTYGSGDVDNLSYYTSTGRTKGYQFNVGSQTIVSTLNWNENGTLQQLAITDPLNTQDTQTCTYSHDDLIRIAAVNCVNGSTNRWNQTFSVDPFGNVSKSVPGGGTGITFNPTYNASTNQFATIPGANPTYDADGDVTADGSHTFSWDADGNAVSIDSVNVTYDALDRAVEQSRNGSYTQIVYGPGGAKLALVNGQTLQKAVLNLPGGGRAVYNSSGLAYYGHTDWLGSQRLGTSSSQTMLFNVGYGPYGESYGASGSPDVSFTGQNSDTVSGLNDFLYREYNPIQGRWPSPDLAGISAVDTTSPQTWNRYAYVTNNPLANVDPVGQDCLEDCGDGGLFFAGAPGFLPSFLVYGASWYHGATYNPSGGGGFDFSFGFSSNGFGTNGGTWSEWQVPLPSSPSQAVQALWQDALNLPTIPCQSQFGPWCDQSELPDPWILDSWCPQGGQGCIDDPLTAETKAFHNCLFKEMQPTWGKVKKAIGKAVWDALKDTLKDKEFSPGETTIPFTEAGPEIYDKCFDLHPLAYLTIQGPW